MRVLLVSDVHANLEALQAVLAAAGEFDMIWSLGDIVGYGPNPNECIELLRTLCHQAISGNHDWGVLGRLDLADFNEDARRANLWTREHLSETSRAYLETLVETCVMEDFTLAHGSPRYPIWEYLVYPSIAKQSFDYFATSICLVGHTHVPMIFEDEPGTPRCRFVPPTLGELFELGNGRFIVNPGSVGQPRDGDPRAAYAILDTTALTILHQRVAYDVAATQAKILSAELPRRSSVRLEVGW